MIVFLLDENLGRSTQEFLQNLGFGVRTLHELKLLSKPDEIILRRAAKDSSRPKSSYS